ncbi:GMP synthase [Maricurvus nonylphenolicus]|uniref:glutamine amidotransferase-related protein n=1 Tax=Maricurvus nonylphenolicus TaxID=1008307 RepID=UPI0036F3CA59
MRIGLLQCDEVLEDLQPEFGTYPKMFTDLFERVSQDIEWIVYNAVDGELPDDIDACDGYITTGSRYGVNDGDDWIDRLQDFLSSLVSANKKYVGICFGHQLLAKALGGTVERSPKGWGVGVSFNQVNHQKDWMMPFQDSMDLVVSHQDQVINLPEHAEVLASSNFCPFYIVQYSPNLMSVQGHPEFSKEYSSELMNRRRDRIPPARGREGQASLSAQVDDILMATWIVNFFNSSL